MNIKHLALKLAAASVLCLSAAASQATTIGPVYPAPGGNNWSGNGVSGADGTAVWNYSNFDTNAFDSLYFGLNQTNYGALGAGLDYVANPFSFDSASGNTAIWQANTVYFNGTGHIGAQTRLTMTVTGLGATPWITNLASIGLDTGFGDLGAVVDNSAGADFTLAWKVEADVGAGFQAINSIQQQQSHDGATRSSVGTGFYYTEPAVTPAPATLAMLALGLVGFGFSRRRNAA